MAPNVSEERGPVCSNESMMASHPRAVWILGRPLSHALTVTSLAESSVGKYHVNHWGALITISISVMTCGWSAISRNRD